MTATRNRLWSLLAATTLVGALSACSNDTTTVTEPPASSPTAAPGDGTTGDPTSTDPTPTSTPEVPPIEIDPETGKGQYCKNQAPFTGEAADEFGADEVADAYCTMVTLMMDQYLIDSNLRSSEEDLTVKDFSVWNDYQLKETADEWNANVAKALDGDFDAKEDVWTLMQFDVAGEGSGFIVPEDEPAVLDKAFTPASTSVDEVGGRKRLIMKFHITGGFNLRQDETNDPFVAAFDHEIAFALVRNPTGDDERIDWLIESWSAHTDISAPVERGPLPTAPEDTKNG